MWKILRLAALAQDDKSVCTPVIRNIWDLDSHEYLKSSPEGIPQLSTVNCQLSIHEQLSIVNSRSPSSDGFRDGAAAQDQVPLVAHHGLTRGNGPHGGVETHPGKAI